MKAGLIEPIADCTAAWIFFRARQGHAGGIKGLNRDIAIGIEMKGLEDGHLVDVAVPIAIRTRCRRPLRALRWLDRTAQARNPRIRNRTKRNFSQSLRYRRLFRHAKQALRQPDYAIISRRCVDSSIENRMLHLVKNLS